MSPSYSSGLSSSDDSPPISHKVSNHLATKLDNTSNGLVPNVCSDVMIVDDSPQIYGPDELYQDSCNNETSTSKTSFDDSANIKRQSLIPMEREVISSVNPIEPPKNTSNEKGCDLELGLFLAIYNSYQMYQIIKNNGIFVFFVQIQAVCFIEKPTVQNHRKHYKFLALAQSQL